MDPLEIKKRIFAANKLFSENTTTKEKFESVRSLVKGINPKLDKLLEETSISLAKLEKLQQGEYIELTTEHLPEDTEEKKKRKKELLLFIKNWKSLQDEVKRVEKEMDLKTKSTEEDIAKIGKIASGLKGPVGLITAFAVIIVIGLSVLGRKKSDSNTLPKDMSNTAKKAASSKEKIKVIIVENKQIPLTELTTSQGAECMDGREEASHYHAKDHIAAKALDGSTVNDPGGCGFGKVKEVEIFESE